MLLHDEAAIRNKGIENEFMKFPADAYKGGKSKDYKAGEKSITRTRGSANEKQIVTECRDPCAA